MLNDLRHAFRSLRRSPFFCAMALLTLALGIGINTAMFSIIDGTLLRGLPMSEQHRVLRIYPHGSDGVSEIEFQELRAQQQSFVDLGVYEDRSVTFSEPGRDAERLNATVLTASTVQFLEAPLALGRWQTAAEDQPGAPGVVVISHALWQNRFQADPAVLGRSVRMDDDWATIIGVAAPGFRFPHSQEAWLPPRGLHRNEPRDEQAYQLIGRLKPGVSMAQAQTELVGMTQRLALAAGVSGNRPTPRLETLADSYSSDVKILWVMLGAVFLVLLIACANVANLLLARAVVRSRELAVRTALGAARSQLVRLLLTESAVLAVFGALLGVGVAWVCIAAFREAVVNATPPYWMVFALDTRALIYTAALAVVACLGAGLVPALRLSRPDLNATLSDGSRGATSGRIGRITRAMVIGEIALSCALLVLSTLMIRSVLKMQSLPLGFEAQGVFTGRVSLPARDYPTATAQRAFFDRVLDDLRARPEVESAAVGSLLPTWNNQTGIVLDGRAAPAPGTRGPVATLRAISPEYLATLRIGLLEGRGFSALDTAETQPVALVSRAFADQHWPGLSALGQRVRVGTGKPDEPVRWLTVVGLVATTVQGRFDAVTPPQLYVPLAQAAEAPRLSVFVRARGSDATALAPLLRSAVRSQDAGLPIYFAQPLTSLVAEAMFYRKLLAGLFSVFGAAAFLLAVVGLYGVMSYAVAQRRHEMGVRLALGATARNIVSLILRQGAWQLALGLTAGFLLAAFGGSLLASILYGVSPHDLPSFLATFVALGAAGLLASLIPGLRASRVPPAEALRAD